MPTPSANWQKGPSRLRGGVNPQAPPPAGAWASSSPSTRSRPGPGRGDPRGRGRRRGPDPLRPPRDARPGTGRRGAEARRPRAAAQASRAPASPGRAAGNKGGGPAGAPRAGRPGVAAPRLVSVCSRGRSVLLRGLRVRQDPGQDQSWAPVLALHWPSAPSFWEGRHARPSPQPSWESPCVPL